MTRLIVVTFAALGWAFYVMSGGPDFEPRGTRAAAHGPVTQPRTADRLVAAKPKDLVTRAVARPAKPVEPRPRPLPVAQTPGASAVLAQVAAGMDTPLAGVERQAEIFSLASLDETAPLALRETPVAPEATPTQVAPAPKDIREVSGTRVNMRDGPGTIYPIVGKARMGQRVEVLSDSGTGWLRLRVLPEQQVGWISASLIRKSAN